jgi:subtilisin family serine protease
VRRFIAGVVIVLAATALSPAGVSLAASSRAASSADEVASVPDELLVAYRHGASEAHRAEARGRAKAELVDAVVRQGGGRAAVELVRIKGIDRSEATRRFTSNPNVAFAEPNWIYTHSDIVVNDSYYTNGSLWGAYGNVSVAGKANQYGSQAAEAWAAGNTGSPSVYVGIIDEGYQYDHPDLRDNVATNPGEIPGNGVDDDGNGYVDDVYGWDFDGGDNTVFDGAADDHGTHVAGTIGAKGGNGQGVAGMTWDVKLLSAKFLGVNGGTTANAVKAVDYFTDLKAAGVNIVATNNSWSGGGYSESLRAAIARANAQNIVFVAAAGNSGRNNDSTAVYPASYDVPNVISVAAIDATGAKASFSNYGARTVDLGAPGVAIWSTLPTNSYGAYNGTSMAAPHVTGAVALYAAASPGAAVDTVKRTILSTAVPTTALAGKTVTGGRLDAGRFAAATLPVPPVPSVWLNVGMKKKAGTPVTVAWTGFVGTNVDLYRNGTRITTTSNDGNYVESLKSTGPLTYKVCEIGGLCAEAGTVL